MRLKPNVPLNVPLKKPRPINALGNGGNVGNVFPSLTRTRTRARWKIPENLPHLPNVPRTQQIRRLRQGNVPGNVMKHVPQLLRVRPTGIWEELI
jgi:hypothetical protein